MVKIFSNLHLKIIAFIAAVFLWFFVVGVDNTVSVFPEPLNIEVSSSNKNISIASTLPQAKIYLKGDEEIIKNLSKNDFSAFIDISDKGVGEYRVPILVNSKNSQVSVVKIEPNDVMVKLAPLAEKEVNVKINAKGTPKEGYKVGEIKTETTKAKIAGAQTVLDMITNATAELILDGTETADISRKVTLSIPEVNLPPNSLEINPNEIQVTVTILSEMNEKEVSVIPSFKTQQEQNLWSQKIILNPAKIIIKGDNEALKNIDSISTSPINVGGLPTLTTPLALEVVLPPNVQLANPGQKVFLSITKESFEEESFSPSINFTSASGTKLLTASTYTITVRVKGPTSIIQKLKKEDIFVNVNLDAAQGTGTLNISNEDIVIPEGLQLIDSSPKQVQVELSL